MKPAGCRSALRTAISSTIWRSVPTERSCRARVSASRPERCATREPALSAGFGGNRANLSGRPVERARTEVLAPATQVFPGRRPPPRGRPDVRGLGDPGGSSRFAEGESRHAGTLHAARHEQQWRNAVKTSLAPTDQAGRLRILFPETWKNCPLTRIAGEPNLLVERFARSLETNETQKHEDPPTGRAGMSGRAGNIRRRGSPDIP